MSQCTGHCTVLLLSIAPRIYSIAQGMTSLCQGAGLKLLLAYSARMHMFGSMATEPIQMARDVVFFIQYIKCSHPAGLRRGMRSPVSSGRPPSQQQRQLFHVWRAAVQSGCLAAGPPAVLPILAGGCAGAATDGEAAAV